MANPKAIGGILRRLMTPAGVMIVTTALVFLSLSDHRVDPSLDRVDAVPSIAATSAPAAAPVVATAPLAGTATVEASTAARPRDRLVVAAIRPERGLVEALLPASGGPGGGHAGAGGVVVAKLATEESSQSTKDQQAQSLRDWEGDAFVGPLPQPQVEVAPTAQAEVELDAAVDAIAEVEQESAASAGAIVAAEPVAVADPAVSETASASAATPKAEPHRHPLGFDPLREPALAGAASKAATTGKTGIAALIPTDEEHTVRYAREVAHEVRSGETLSTVLSRHGVPAADVTKWLTAVSKQYNPNRIYAGQTISLLLDMPEKRLRRVKFEIGRAGSLVIEDNGSTLVAKQKAPPQESSIRVVEGEITSSLYAVANANGVPDRIISEAAEVLGWEINLGRDLQRGARFRLAYEETMRVDTRESWAGRLLAIELINQGKHYEGFHFATADGKTSGYYNRKGQGLGRAFLRYPVAFSRISSQFSTSRYHPVLKRNRPHYGVDFAAPTGTPVKAAADGTVTMAGWHGGNGRFVKIRHDKQYESGYSHLSRIASGLRAGTRVKQGQVIGYVGSTGLASGPHLHFAMYSYGKYVDPMKTALPRTMPLSGSSLASFKSQLSKVEKVYAANGMGPFGSPSVATAAVPAKSTRR